MSTGYNAGIDSSDVLLSYGEESVWGVLPAVAFKAVRMTGEGFSEQKTRARPEEIRTDGFMSHAITTQVAATGSLNLAFSYGTYDDLLAGALNGTWTTPLTIDGVAGDISSSPTANGGIPGFTSTASGKFDNIVPGQWIRVGGFAGANNNGLFRVLARTTGATPYITVAGSGAAAITAETPTGTNAKIRGSMLRNGVTVRTYHFQKQLASALYLLYSGCYVSEATLNAQVGGFLEGSFTFIAKAETKGTTNASTGPVVAAPTGRVVDTVTGVGQLEVNGTAIQAVAQGVSWSISKNNARSQFGIGQAAAFGMARGTIDVTGSLMVYFKDFTLYDLYKAETDQIVSFRALDNDGVGYVFTMPAATLMNPQIVAGGPDTDVMAEFELEGNEGTGAYVGVVFQIDKIPPLT